MGDTKVITHAHFQDGQLVIPESEPDSPKQGLDKRLDYLYVLQAIQEIPFGVGKNLLIDYLQGKKNPSIERNRLNLKRTYASLAYDKDELSGMIHNLLLNDILTLKTLQGNKRWKVLEITTKGRRELESPTLYKKKLRIQEMEETIITDSDRARFEHYKDDLKVYNDPQKKAITSPDTHILTIAGAGTGKTTVLTQRIRHLIQYNGIAPHDILAITFTRKARQEMQARLKTLHIHGVHIETFNSHSEKTLQKYNDLIYTRKTRVIAYRDKIQTIHSALSRLNTTMDAVLQLYYSDRQREDKTNEELARIFINDCFNIRDYFKTTNVPLTQNSFLCQNNKQHQTVRLIVGICNYINAYMRKQGLRDYTDQLVDTIQLYQRHPETIPSYSHLLIDEYQDVNNTQMQLVDLLDPHNIFCVGDPRQSIYGWRGSNIRHILNFPETYPGSQIIHLTINYRSTSSIVRLINAGITTMHLPDLKSNQDGEKHLTLNHHKNEREEHLDILEMLDNTAIPLHEIFILARTNRQLRELSELLKEQRIPYVLKTDETRRSTPTKKDHVTLATIHAVKGLEAHTVHLIGCTIGNFPCKGSEHPIIDLLQTEEYDKEEEERRLFYVAMSRAKDSLHLHYSGRTPTYFITEKMKRLIRLKSIKK